MRDVCSSSSFAKLLVTGPGLACWPPPAWQCQDLEDPNLSMEWEGDHRPDPNLLAALGDAQPVDTDMPFPDQSLCKGPALHQPDEKEEAIKPHRPVSA